MEKNSKYSPSPEWFSTLVDMIYAYRKAKEAKDYATSDALRKKLESAGVVNLDTDPHWNPVFESVESRSARLK